MRDLTRSLPQGRFKPSQHLCKRTTRARRVVEGMVWCSPERHRAGSGTSALARPRSVEAYYSRHGQTNSDHRDYPPGFH